MSGRFLSRLLLLLALVPAVVAFAVATGLADENEATDQAVPAPAPGSARPDYPPSPRGNHVDTYFGVDVPDPYRWLEDADSWATQGWIAAQNELTFGYLKAIPQRPAIEARLTELQDHERFGTPWREGDRYFYSYNSGLQNQSVLYTVESLDADPRVLIDPNSFSEDGTRSLAGTQVSPDGRYIAYGISDGGSDWRTWYVRDIATGEDLDDVIEWVKFSRPSWLPDGSGFFYNQYPRPEEGAELQSKNEAPKTYLHRIGTPQSEDELIHEDPEHPDWSCGFWVTDDGQWLVKSTWNGTERKSNYEVRRYGADEPFTELVGGFTARWGVIDNIGSVFYLQTDLDAPRGRVVAIDVNQPQPEHWRTVVPQREETLDDVNLVGNRLFCGYLKDARTMIRVVDPADGKDLGEVKLPGIGSAGGFRGKRTDTETFYRFSGFTTPGTIYRYDIASGESTVYRRPQIDVDLDDYVTEQVFVTSVDGTKVPLFITRRRDIELDGSHPALLYGYGGFNISMQPYFSLSRTVWLEMGGIYAVACLRGGGEYGEEWHVAGTKQQKQNVFDDFISCAEYLIDSGHTNRRRLAIQGGSNGGLLVGACMTQRPDLFGACLPAVGVMDMLRYHTFTIGWAWANDYGTSEESEAMFRYLYSYSPVHNCHPDRYPPTLITTADRDDRVVPAHSFKFAAALQHAQMADAPVLIRIETRAGHGGGTPTSKRIEQTADILAFLAKTFDIKVPARAADENDAGGASDDEGANGDQ